MEATLYQIDQLIKTFNGLKPLKPEYQQQLDRKIRLEFNYNSNHIEGNTLTYNDTELLLIFDKTTGNQELRELEEMKAHDVAFEMIKEWASENERPLTEAAIKNLHEVLLVRPFWKDVITPDGQQTRRLIKVGDYKEFPNSVRLQNGEIFNYASPQDTPIKMGELIQWYREAEQNENLHPIALAALFHYKFVCIHPFDDGNGRLSRLLMNYILLKHNLPSVIIKTADKKNYLFALNKADTGDLDSFVKYIAKQLIWSIELSIKAARGENLTEPKDWEKKLQLLKAQNEQKKHFKIKKSQETIDVILSNCIIPFLEQLLVRVADFNELFSQNNITIQSKKYTREVNNIEGIVKFFADVFVLADLNEHIIFEYNLYEYRYFNNDQLPMFNCKLRVQWIFENIFYKLQIINKGSIIEEVEKFYHEVYSEDEIELYLNKFAEGIMGQIEEKLN